DQPAGHLGLGAEQLILAVAERTGGAEQAQRDQPDQDRDEPKAHIAPDPAPAPAPPLSATSADPSSVSAPRRSRSILKAARSSRKLPAIVAPRFSAAGGSPRNGGACVLGCP